MTKTKLPFHNTNTEENNEDFIPQDSESTKPIWIFRPYI